MSSNATVERASNTAQTRAFLSKTGTKIVVAPDFESPERRASAMAPSAEIGAFSASGRAGPGWKALPSG